MTTPGPGQSLVRADFRRRRCRRSLAPPPPAKLWSARQPDLVRASRKVAAARLKGLRR